MRRRRRRCRRSCRCSPVPLQTLVVNVTNQCNLACTYCYEYGEDKIVDTENGQQPKFMSEETAREAVEFALRESRDNPHAHITFFGGETLMNFPGAEGDDRLRAPRGPPKSARTIDFSLTTNATLLRPGRDRVPRRRARRRDDFDRRPRGAAGQVPRLQQRHGQLRRLRRRRSRRCWRGIARGRSARA